ncbi:hypothetical protein ONZ51_g11683 [Trametes cubensis]|uniref:Uncharacterized protein n=1 Tax=Trametes cubensis TaxID=1111947 RepID=A0AAD7X7M2_9APHY|nr:hypothetical protein ONZ51_g11683 [Trametes cubensis]
MPKVSTWSVTDGAPLRTLAGLVNFDDKMRETDPESDDGPATTGRFSCQRRRLSDTEERKKGLTINRDWASGRVDALLQDTTDARPPVDDLERGVHRQLLVELLDLRGARRGRRPVGRRMLGSTMSDVDWAAVSAS